MVVNGTQVKIYAWYDNEWGYANRTVELARSVVGGWRRCPPIRAPHDAGLRQYLLVTGNYWAFTLTDGALRMLVVLHFHQLGYSAAADRLRCSCSTSSSASSPTWSAAGWARASG
jgi:hypothetical protein